ncbi:beta-ketoacyl-ACP synthase I, partial [Alphaproteobacteria bacterium]|nr:beta-ketoacyl-ACP synthase I [Alphaproteobacteria bacterium]
DIDLKENIDKRLWRFMGDAAGYVHLSMEQAIKDAKLEENHVINERTGIIVGSGGPSTRAQVAAADITREKGPKRVGPFAVPKAMCSTTSATAATNFQIKGVNYTISSACSTSAHCIGNAAEQIQMGKQDIMFAGGGEELDWTLSVLFDAMGAMSSKYNDTPEKAARAYDADRDGFVISGGGGIVVLEELEHAKARGAKIYGEITGYGATSDGADMVAPSGEGGRRAMLKALETVTTPVTYINTHGTSTPVGDIGELQAIKEAFDGKQDIPHISATKSMTGHSLGATGVQEAIYCLLMMQNDFVAPSINIENLDEGAKDFPIAQTRIDDVKHETVISNSFGFGGTNCTLAISKYKD